MNLIQIINNDIKHSKVNLSLLSNNQDELTDNPILNFVHLNHNDSDFKLAFLNELNHFNDTHDCQTVILTADNSFDDIENVLEQFAIYNIVFFIQDFKDGRTFSLIRHLKKLNFVGGIYLLGFYGLDQAGYYYKSGANGFFAKDEQLTTLQKTLDDLKSGHFGTSVNSLPMFQ